jgi:hypothetical protein
MGLLRNISAWWRHHQRTGEEIHRRIILDVMTIDEAMAHHEMTPGQRHKFEMSFLRKFRADPVEFARKFPTFFDYVPEHLKDHVSEAWKRDGLI